MSEVLAQGYPAKLTRVIAAYPPGGTTDIVARMIAQKFPESQGRPWVVEKRADAYGERDDRSRGRAASRG